MEKNSNFKSESFAMCLAGALGLKKLRWSLRRLHCPVSASALVLEVGAGGNPYPRANVLLDAMESTVERNEQQLIVDRPLVLGLCEELPFKNKAFDFIVASHVLEHTDNPEKFLSELMRVGKAGYIETPEGWFEKMCAFTYHRLEVSNANGRLLIKKKTSWKPEDIADLYDLKLSQNISWAKFLRINPDLNHMRFYWRDSIDFEILNPQDDAGWAYPVETPGLVSGDRSLRSILRNYYLFFRRWLYSQVSRNKTINIFELLRCPTCHGEMLEIDAKSISCKTCQSVYEVSNGVPKLFPLELEGFNQTRLSR